MFDPEIPGLSCGIDRTVQVQLPIKEQVVGGLS